MKSINEKAEEYVLGFHSSIHRMCKESYIDGANYVVEQIEKLVKTTIGEGETYHYNLYIGLVNLLEQLKK